MAAPIKNGTDFSHKENKWLVLIRTWLVPTSCYLVKEDANTDDLILAIVLW